MSQLNQIDHYQQKCTGRKTHTDQYLSFESNHSLQHKRSVVRSLMDRAEKLTSKEEDKKTEVQHIKKVLKTNKYKPWSFNLPKKRSKQNNQENPPDPQIDNNNPQIPVDDNLPVNINNINIQGRTFRPRVMLPYIRETSEKLLHIYKQHGVDVCHKPFNKLRNFLVKPKDPIPDKDKCGVVYLGTCDSCKEQYVGETARSAETRIKDHFNPKKEPPTAIQEHLSIMKHKMTMKSFSLLTSEDKLFNRRIKESLFIKQYQPSLNRDGGYQLAAVYDEILSRDRVPPDGHVTRRVSSQ